MDSTNNIPGLEAALAIASKTYVYDNIEVKLTGRTATNKLRSGKTDELVEYTPTDSMVGSWKKWCRLNQLFEVT